MPDATSTEDANKAKYRAVVKKELEDIKTRLNAALRGKELEHLEKVLQRLGRGGKIPHWFQKLSTEETLPNADGKTVGSILEMLLVAIIEVHTLKKHKLTLKVNPARGVDLPDLDLGVKSPSKNYCTSEPFFSAYERLYGNENDCIVLLTNYQDAKGNGGLKLQVLKAEYMAASEIADKELCRIALKARSWPMPSGGEAGLQRIFKFLCYANQSDWQCRRLLRLVDLLHDKSGKFTQEEKAIEKDFDRINKDRAKKGSLQIPDEELAALKLVFATKGNEQLALTNALEDWITEFLKDASRNPNENEWNRLRRSPLDGRIGMSFALQWRYNFGQVFSKGDVITESTPIQLCSDSSQDEAIAGE